MRTDRQWTADYIGDMTRQLTDLAKRYRLRDLSLLLAMAELQAAGDAYTRLPADSGITSVLAAGGAAPEGGGDAYRS